MDPFRFVKVEDFFNDFQEWSKLETVTDWKLDNHRESNKYRTISLHFGQSNCTLLIQFVGRHTFRVRFHPGKSTADDYSANNTRSVVLDTFSELQEYVEKYEFSVSCSEPDSETIEASTEYDGASFIRMKITRSPFSIAVYSVIKCEDKVGVNDQPVWQTAEPSIYYRKSSNDGDFDVIQAVNSPCAAKYFGFGEQGEIQIWIISSHKLQNAIYYRKYLGF